MNRKVRLFILALLVLTLIIAFASLGQKEENRDFATDFATAELSVETSIESVALESTTAVTADLTSESGTEQSSSDTEYSVQAATEISTSDEEYSVEAATEASIAAEIDEYGVYDSKDEVALYIVTYDKLPSNYITKKKAKKLGWSGGSLEPYAPGKCIGGDYFGNYEGKLPEDAEYHECDIDTLGKKSRGAKRLVFSEDGYIYYTEDHYETFELLYEP